MARDQLLVMRELGFERDQIALELRGVDADAGAARGMPDAGVGEAGAFGGDQYSVVDQDGGVPHSAHRCLGTVGETVEHLARSGVDDGDRESADAGSAEPRVCWRRRSAGRHDRLRSPPRCSPGSPQLSIVLSALVRAVRGGPGRSVGVLPSPADACAGPTRS